MDIPETQVFKIILVGDQKVGKTDIFSRFVRGSLSKGIPTIGVEFATKTIQLAENELVKLQIWDTAGQQRYRSITSAHYRKSFGALLVYDITKQETFQSLRQFLEDVRFQTDKDIVIMVVGNKKDLVDTNQDERKVSQAEAIDFAQQNNILFEEVSAVSGDNIENSFIRMTTEIYKRRNIQKIEQQPENITQFQEKQ